MPTKDTPTPNIEVKGDGLHRFTFTLREGPGITLDRFVIHDIEGKMVAEIQAEDAPPLPILPDEVFLCGGGADNPVDAQALNARH